jgi:hypothetical protein
MILINFSCEKEKNGVVDVTTKADKENGIKRLSFYEKGTLNKTLEYVNLCGKDYLNQGWYFSAKGDTVASKSHFCKIDIDKHVLKQLEKVKIRMTYKPLLKNTISGILLCKENNIDYCELENKKCDTAYFVKNKLQLSLRFKNKGKVKVTGYVLEVSDKLTNGKYDERKVYFTLNFNVK